MCEACSAAKTGAADGTCSPVTAATDPDNECPMACADGAVTNQCNGHGACATTSCGGYQCSSATACATACVGESDCVNSSYCDASMTCVKRLRVALVAGAGSCLDENTAAYPQVAGLLVARGHIPVLALDTDVDTLAKMQAFDVIITGGPGNSTCAKVNWATFDGAIADYVNAGGGVVSTGWTLYNESEGIPSHAPNLVSVLPNTGNVYVGGASTITPVGNDPISMGLGTFSAPAFLPYGSATPKAGATIIATSGAFPAAESWTVGNGRTVFLAPLYVEAYESYAVQSLTDGTQPNAVEMLLRSIEWAGKQR